MSDRYDIVILGGGLVGVSLACALGDLGLHIGIVEARTPALRARPAYGESTIAVSYSSRRIFEGLGVWSAMTQEAEPIGAIEVSERGRWGSVRLDAAEQNREALGYTIPTRVITAALYEGAQALPDVTTISPARLEDIRTEDRQVRLNLRGQGVSQEIRTRLLVGADGMSSSVREHLGIPVVRWDYGQSAVIANVTWAQPHQGRAFERFTPDGPMAVLPLTRGRSTLVWTVDSAEVDRLLELDDQAFSEAVQARFGYRQGTLQKVGPRTAYPLSLVHAREHVRPRAALIGNAAHTIHPVAAQGFNLGLRDVAVLAETVAEAARRWDDPGARTALTDYARRRRADHRRVITFTDVLVRVFGTDLAPVRWGRGAAMVTLSALPPLRRYFAHQAMGMSAPAPRLIRGLPVVPKGGGDVA